MVRSREAKTEGAAHERALSEPAILDATLALIRRNGAAALTMRQLADELGVSTMAAYYYVESKDALLRRVGDYVYASVEVPSVKSRTWYEQLPRWSWQNATP